MRILTLSLLLLMGSVPPLSVAAQDTSEQTSAGRAAIGYVHLNPRRTTFEEDVLGVDHVVYGVVKAVHDTRRNDFPFKQYDVHVLRDDEGDGDHVISVIVPGSRDATPPIVVVGAPTFGVGDELVLLLDDLDESQHHIVRSASSGAYRATGPERAVLGRGAGANEPAWSFFLRLTAMRTQAATQLPR